MVCYCCGMSKYLVSELRSSTYSPGSGANLSPIVEPLLKQTLPPAFGKVTAGIPAFRSIFAYVCHQIHPALQPNSSFQGFPWVQALGWRGTTSGCHQLQWRRWGRWQPGDGDLTDLTNKTLKFKGHRSWRWNPCISGYKQRFAVDYPLNQSIGGSKSLAYVTITSVFNSTSATNRGENWPRDVV